MNRLKKVGTVVIIIILNILMFGIIPLNVLLIWKDFPQWIMIPSSVADIAVAFLIAKKAFTGKISKKIEESENSCNLEVLIYDHFGHFIFPESMMQLLLPRFLVDLIIPRVFSDAKGFVKECRKSRIDLDKHIQSTIKEWIIS